MFPENVLGAKVTYGAPRAQFQPRPRRYTQYLNLAISIIGDLRIDRSKRTAFWEIDKDPRREVEDWGADEIRALAGTYFLASK